MLGWREWASLPELGVDAIKVKVDTGARTSALHAFRPQRTTRDGVPHVRFEIHPVQRSRTGAITVEVPVVDEIDVRSSNGQVQRRPVIRTDIAVGPSRWTIDVTLTRRDQMGFRMLLGRAGVRRRFLVDPARSYVHGGRR